MILRIPMMPDGNAIRRKTPPVGDQPEAVQLLNVENYPPANTIALAAV
jgi:hypothetical protein